MVMILILILCCFFFCVFIIYLLIKVNRDEFDLIFLNYVMFEYYLRNMIWYVLLIVLNVVKMEFVRIIFLKSIFYNKWVLKGFNLENICMFI